MFASKVMPLLFDTLSRFVVAFLLMSKCLLYGCRNHPVILEPKSHNKRPQENPTGSMVIILKDFLQLYLYIHIILI